MFIRSSTAINDRLIKLSIIEKCYKRTSYEAHYIDLEICKCNCSEENYSYKYESQEARDKAFEELCAFLNSNYKLRDFT